MSAVAFEQKHSGDEQEHDDKGVVQIDGRVYTFLRCPALNTLQMRIIPTRISNGIQERLEGSVYRVLD